MRSNLADDPIPALVCSAARLTLEPSMSTDFAQPSIDEGAGSRAAGVDDRSDKVCVIGAGTSGLAAARRLLEAGIPFDCLEREEDLGGNWNYGQACSSVYASTHLISSKKLTEYPDFPMPEGWPEFPHHRLVLEYLRGFASHFGLLEHIEFGAGIARVAPASENPETSGWMVELESGQKRRYRAIVIANGHNWDPSLPNFDGEFDGLELHSGEYKTPDVLRDKRVLVVGGGNSGCDIAVESSLHAASTRLSLRRGYHFLPKFFHGTPIDVCGERLLWCRVPLPLRRIIAHVMMFFLQGPRLGTGLPKPDHKLFETHPTINSNLIYALRHGDLEIRPDIERLCGDRVRFTDGSEEPLEVIIYATGFKLSFPFIDAEVLNWKEGRPELYLNVFHPQRHDLFVVGMIQPDSGQWGLVDWQSQVVAQYLVSKSHGASAAERFEARKRNTATKESIRYIDTSRHLVEVEHYSYRQALKRERRKLRAGVRGQRVRA